MEEKIMDLGIAKIKIPKPKQIKETKVILIGKCPFCKREIRAITQSQFDWNLALHVKQKHKDNEGALILLKQLEETNNEKR